MWSVSLAWEIELTDAAAKATEKIGHTEAKRIRDYLRERQQPLEDPRQLGSSLTRQLGELWRAPCSVIIGWLHRLKMIVCACSLFGRSLPLRLDGVGE